MDDGKAWKFNALTWPCHIIEEEWSKSWVFLFILVDKSMVYSYNNLAAQISVPKSQNKDFGRAVSLCLLIRNCRFLIVMPQTISFHQYGQQCTLNELHHITQQFWQRQWKKIQLPVLLHTLLLLDYWKTWAKMEP